MQNSQFTKPITCTRRDVMQNVIGFFQKLFRNDDGQTLSEYALIIALVVVVAIAALTLLGGNITAMFQQIAGAI